MGFDKVEFGKIIGIPVVIDVSLILLAVLYGSSYFMSGDVNDVSYGLILIAGVIVSVLLHEAGHAVAGRYYRIPTSHIELNGCGGLCHFARALPPDHLPNVVILLSGPAVTLMLWLALSQISEGLDFLPERWGFLAGLDRVNDLVWHLAYINKWLLIFNLLPSHPLDGGRAMAFIAGRWAGYDRAMRAVAYAGLLVVAWLVWSGMQGATFSFVVAFSLFQSNMQVMAVHRGPRWTRWN